MSVRPRAMACVHSWSRGSPWRSFMAWTCLPIASRRGCAGLRACDLRVGDATAMPYADRSFDLVCEQFCFCHIPDDAAKASIAREMMRVSRGFILIHDWRMGSASRQLYGVSKARMREWFPGWEIGARFRSQLWPPLGRPISRLAPLLYDVARLAGPLVGSWITILSRR